MSNVRRYILGRSMPRLSCRLGNNDAGAIATTSFNSLGCRRDAGVGRFNRPAYCAFAFSTPSGNSTIEVIRAFCIASSSCLVASLRIRSRGKLGLGAGCVTPIYIGATCALFSGGDGGQVLGIPCSGSKFKHCRGCGVAHDVASCRINTFFRNRDHQKLIVNSMSRSY